MPCRALPGWFGANGLVEVVKGRKFCNFTWQDHEAAFCLMVLAASLTRLTTGAINLNMCVEPLW